MSPLGAKRPFGEARVLQPDITIERMAERVPLLFADNR